VLAGSLFRSETYIEGLACLRLEFGSRTQSRTQSVDEYVSKGANPDQTRVEGGIQRSLAPEGLVIWHWWVLTVSVSLSRMMFLISSSNSSSLSSIDPRACSSVSQLAPRFSARCCKYCLTRRLEKTETYRCIACCDLFAQQFPILKI
jgi:hypothetical protein